MPNRFNSQLSLAFVTGASSGIGTALFFMSYLVLQVIVSGLLSRSIEKISKKPLAENS